MKSTISRILYFTFVLAIAAGCRKNFVISEKQSILFQLDYVNYAWGYQHVGYIIDSEGNVFSYRNPEDWNFPDDEYNISEKQVNDNLSKCVLTNIQISKEELTKYTSYIKNISSSKVTALKNVAADAGSTEFLCYQYSESNNAYKGYLIKMEGDFTCENLNFYSKKVVAWMRETESILPDK